MSKNVPLRFSRRDLIKELFSKGETASSRFFSLRFSNSLSKRQIVSFVIPAKYAPTAISRNKVKRRGRAIVSKYKTDLKDTFSGVFLAKPDILKASFKELEASIKDIIGKIK